MKNPLKNVPKWAWFVAAGVGVGGIALRTLQNRRDAAAVEGGTSGTDPSTGQPLGTAPPGVIVPPVIMGGDGGGGEGSAALSDLSGVLGQGFSDVLATAGNLAWTPAEISGLLTTVGSNTTDQLRAIIGSAGGAPQPASQVPTVINVTGPSSAPAAPSVPTPAAARCPTSFPLGSPPNCYKDCKHTDKDAKGKSYCNQGHCYQRGDRVHVRNTPGSC